MDYCSNTCLAIGSYRRVTQQTCCCLINRHCITTAMIALLQRSISLSVNQPFLRSHPTVRGLWMLSISSNSIQDFLHCKTEKNIVNIKHKLFPFSRFHFPLKSLMIHWAFSLKPLANVKNPEKLLLTHRILIFRRSSFSSSAWIFPRLAAAL